jgi:hypothetical protein
MDATVTFSLYRKEKEQLDLFAHEVSIKERKKITNGELIRRAIRQVYGVTLNGKPKNAGQLGRKAR